MRTEAYAIVAHLAQLAQAKDLKAAAIGQDRVWPAHEAVQPAEARHQFWPRTEQQVIGVREDDARAHGLQIIWPHRFDGGVRAHGHEDRRGDVAVRRMHDARARGGLGAASGDLEGKRGGIGWRSDA